MARRKAPGASAASSTRAATKKSSKAKTRGAAAAGNGEAEVIQQSAVATDDERRQAMEAVVTAAKKDDAAKTTSTSTGLTLGKAIKKAAEVTGFAKEHIAWWCKNRDRDPEELQRERDAEIFGQNKVAAFMNMPLHGQFALLPSGDTVASSTPSEREQKKDSDPQILAAAEAQGFQAGTDAAPRKNDFPKGSKREGRWFKGYDEAQRKRAETIGTGAKSPTHSEPAHA